MSITGGSPVTLATGVVTSGGITTDSQNVYWTDTQNVYSVPIDGGSTRTVSTTPVVGVRPLGDGSTLLLDDDKNGRVLSIPIAGGAVTTLANSQINPVAAQDCGGGNICWANRGSSSVGGPATVGAQQDAAIMNRDPQGQVSVVLKGQYGITYDGHDLYAAGGDVAGGTVVRVQLDGSPPA